MSSTKILALDSSQLQAAVCVLKGDRLLTSECGSVSIAHSEALLPLVDRALKQSGLKLNELDGFAVGVGPGSFTGIRVGCATLKALAQALQKPILGFSSLRALALSLEDSVAMINAYQGQVFVGWQAADGKWLEEPVSASEWCKGTGLSLSQELGKPLLLCGTGAEIYKTQIEAIGNVKIQIQSQIQFATPRGIQAAVLEVLAGSQEQSGFIQYSQLHANYMRPSQAEIKLESVVASSKAN